MTTIKEYLHSLTNYPVPQNVYESQALVRGVNLDEDATIESVTTKECKLLKADIFSYVVNSVSSISQGGVSMSVSSEDKKRLKSVAIGIYEEYGSLEDLNNLGATGYIGDSL